MSFVLPVLAHKYFYATLEASETDNKKSPASSRAAREF